MNPTAAPAWLAAAFSFSLALATVASRHRNLASGLFAAGMACLGLDSLLSGIAATQHNLGQLGYLYDGRLALKAVVTTIWMAFSMVYSRGDARTLLRRSWLLLLLCAGVPLLLVTVFPGDLIEVVLAPDSTEPWLRFRWAAKVINVTLLIGTVLILTNLERTFRAAVGTMQWRIKFLVLGMAVIFFARIYTRSQALVFSGHSNALIQVEIIALIIGCSLITIAYFRRGLEQMEVYPSRAVLHTSVTVLLVGTYLLVVGVLAQLVGRTGGTASFQAQALIVLIALAALAVLLLSERLRQRVRDFVSRHFERPHYESRQIWTRFTESTAHATDDSRLASAATALIAQTFNIMSVSLWIWDDAEEWLSMAASTSQSVRSGDLVSLPASELDRQGVFSLEQRQEEWATTLREITGRQFRRGGDRLAVPLTSGERYLGVVLLADRVQGVAYSLEEIELLRCIGDQIASYLLNLRLAREVLLSKELEAFQTVSAFFVHDLKNAASTLNLMLQNLPLHFDNPQFREDALRSIGSTNRRINEIIERLGSLRSKLELRVEKTDLNHLVEEATHAIQDIPAVRVEKNLPPLRPVVGDPEQLRSVVTNLLLNAREALGENGVIAITTGERDGWVSLSVQDNGCGMAPEFVRDCLFRPFKTTKKKGIGIGMFQTKIIVEAHGGRIRVKSTPGAGTTFQIALPLRTGSK